MPSSKPFSTVNIIKRYNAGSFRFIVKTPSGFLTVYDCRESGNIRFKASPENLLTLYRKGTLYTIEFKPERMDYWFTVFARIGNNIKVIDIDILSNLTMRTISQFYINTNLYNNISAEFGSSTKPYFKI
jgi:hypothetical protein